MGVDAPSYMDSVASWHPATRAVEAAIMPCARRHFKSRRRQCANALWE